MESRSKDSGSQSLAAVPATSDWLDELQRGLAPDAPGVKVSHGMTYGHQRKYVSWRFDELTYSSLELLHITDTQFGHIECRTHRIIEYRDWVLSEPNRFILFGGDMFDSWCAGSPGTPWDQLWSPDNQLYKFVEMWAPARHRILGYVGGNHERRAERGYGDVAQFLAMLLKIPYSNGQQLIDIHFGEHKPFKINMWHGSGAGRTKGSKAQMLHRFMQQGDAQLYLVGHLHDALVVADCRTLRKPGKNAVKVQKIMGAMSSSFVSYWGTYAEVAGMYATDVLMAMATLTPDGKWGVSLR